jgi:hypothetical protein
MATEATITFEATHRLNAKGGRDLVALTYDVEPKDAVFYRSELLAIVRENGCPADIVAAIDASDGGFRSTTPGCWIIIEHSIDD